MRSDFTSATNDDWSTPALSPPVPAAYAFAISRPSPLGSFSLCTAIRVGTPKPLLYSSLTSVPGDLGATIITVISSLICVPSSTMLNPWEYERVEPFFIRGMISLITGVCCLSGVRFNTRSAEGISSSYVPTLNPFSVAFFHDCLFVSIDVFLKVYDTSSPLSLKLRPWFSPWAPHPIMTIFLPLSFSTPLNSSLFINLHWPSSSICNLNGNELK